ncbi:lipopolysaccharide cholinephosphotransferase licd [Plakobranchus ocellatus]|uniref:Lipopolysaccharide cholinephosphotransferase licd n=1 Tax=Plakobranchus ocellatus TaxID=259542 RepID=A0AAV4AD40_9GAST|nr:lipopolysaccharide cholinephosphotransferase licd [Plakobranchus ocellatus]
MALVLNARLWRYLVFPVSDHKSGALHTSDSIRAFQPMKVQKEFESAQSLKFNGVNLTRVLSTSLDSIGKERSLYFANNSDLDALGIDTRLLAFQPRMTKEEKEVVLFVFEKFIHACIKHNVTFFLYGGTLLGSFRHHDIIPWDDDIDVMVSAKDKSRLRAAVTSLSPDFMLHSPHGEAWKFFWIKPRTLLHKQFRWPYIDIFFYLENKTHIFDEQVLFRSSYAYKKTDVFPLSIRPFAGAFLPVPCHIKAVLERTYSPSLCISLRFSHKLESTPPRQLRAILPCKHLHGYYPFVHRELLEGEERVKEELKLGDRIIHAMELRLDT